MGDSPEQSRVQVWDLPTRIFHWLLATGILVEWLTQDDSRYLDFHVFAGYAIGMLILFRLAWGVLGTRWARFASFAYGPFFALRYLVDTFLRRQRHYVGHNPAGTYAIYALLGLGLLTVASGIATLGGQKHHGPLASLTFAQGDVLHEIHQISAWTMLVVILLHLLGVALSSFADRENLALGMVTGRKLAPPDVPPVPRARGVGIAMLVVLLAAAAGYFRGYTSSTPEHPYAPFTGPTLAMDATWNDECGSCHLAYHPSLLPRRSWKALLAQQDNHFGEDLELEPDTAEHLLAFASANSAEHHATAVAWKMDAGIPPGNAPLRITETRYWKHRHEDVSARDFDRVKKTDCAGCHADADKSTFEPGSIHIGWNVGFGTPSTYAGKKK
jgi:cytochrome b